MVQVVDEIESSTGHPLDPSNQEGWSQLQARVEVCLKHRHSHALVPSHAAGMHEHKWAMAPCQDLRPDYCETPLISCGSISAHSLQHAPGS